MIDVARFDSPAESESEKGNVCERMHVLHNNVAETSGFYTSN
jgi:hypothetical protein